MLLALAVLLICSVFWLFYNRSGVKSWSSNLGQRWRTISDPNTSSTDDRHKSKMGNAASSEQHDAPQIDRSDEQQNVGISHSNDEAVETTPKAKPTGGVAPPVPSFTLEGDNGSDDEHQNMPPPSFPAVNSVQRASGPANALNERRETPKLKPLPNGTPGDTQMMPPPRLPQARQPLSSATGGLRVPTTGPLPNRGPPAGRQTSSSLAPPPYKVTNMRQKVTLTPGHSPLDWAALQRSSKNLSGVSTLLRVTPSHLKSMNGRKGKPAWSSYQGKVYNISPYLPFHPGGEGELRRAAGKDGEKLFLDVHPWVNWDNMLGECLVGIMVSEDDSRAAVQSNLDDMD